jgi:exonuclease SbcC
VVKTGEERQRTLQEQLAGRATVERALGDAQGRIRAAEQDRKELAEVQTHLDALQVQLAANDFAAEARVAQEQAAVRLAAIAYDSEQHRNVRGAKDALRGAPDAMRKLDAARVVLTTAASHRGDVEAQRETAQTEATALQAEHRTLQKALAQLPMVRSELAGKERELQTAGAALRHASQLLGEARQMVAWLAGQERERETMTRSQVTARQEEGAYLQLAEAFGKNGIQEMLVDRALPDIQDQANELLAKLSGGRMRVELSTQRTGRTGATISTLDVNVSDELGTRPYELFSGGERFRINFAIRIALSRYLATRAGAPLQMLAIDEGFGSQDREGCDRMIEAIRSIEDDFERILVIPVRIEVTKTAKGSTFSVT